MNDKRGRLRDWVLRFSGSPGDAAGRPRGAGLSHVADGCALATSAIGMLALAGHLLGIQPLKSVLPGVVAMKFNTALTFAIGGAALWWRRRPALRLALGAIMAAFGALALSEHLSGGDWGIDQIFFRDVPAVPSAAFPPGRMALSTSLCFLLCGAALMFSRGSARGRGGGSAATVEAGPGRRFGAEMLAFSAAVIAAFVLIGYATGTESLRLVPGFIGMALNTAAAFVLLAAGILCAAPEGMIARVMLWRAMSRPLWLGFGLLTILLAALGVVAASRLQAIGANIYAEGQVGRPRVDTTRELEINVIDYVLDVGESLTGRAAARQRAAQEAADVGRYLAAYEALSETARQRELAARFAEQWREVYEQGQVLLAEGAPPSEQRLDRLAELRLGLKEFLDRQMQPEAIEAFDIALAAALRGLQDSQVLILGLLISGVLISVLIGGRVSRTVLGHAQVLRESEAKYRALFESIDQGFCTIEVLFDGNQKPVDYLFLMVNPAFERQTGIRNGAGRRIREIAPLQEEYWFRIYGRIALTGEPMRFENTAAQLGRDFDVFAWRIGAPEQRRVAILFNDITARKKADETLRESEERFRLIFETANEGIWVTDADRKTVLVNSRMAGMLGYSIEEMVGQTPSAFLDPDQESIWLETDRTLAAGHKIQQELKFRRKDGSVLWAISNASPVVDSENRRVKTITLVTDITARKRTEEALLESEERAKALIRHAPTGIYEIDLRGKRFISVNDAMCQTLGYTRDELLAIGPLAVLDKESRARFMDRAKRTLSGQPADPSVEFRVLRRDGGAIDAVLYVTFNTAGDQALVVAHDITERKKTEALRHALAEQERLRLGAAVEQASDSIVMLDLDGKIRYANASFVTANRLPRDGATGRSYFDFFAGQSSDAAIKSAVTQGRTWQGAMSRRVPDGRTIDLEVTISPAKDPSGTVIGGLATETDVTHKNALQRQIRQAQKMEALGTLAGGITHDFNNILAAIIINTEMALLDMDQSDPARASLPVVLQAANRGKELVKQIITFSRQRAWERKPIEIAATVRECMSLLRSTLPKNISIREKIDPRSGVVLADPSHIHQILVNLCQNAALAMLDCGGDLEVGLDPIEVDAYAAVRNPDLKPGSYVRLTVSDTGCGIGSEILDRIFEPFFTTRDQGKGSGLGLAVVHGIVKSYDGAISVQSQAGEGSVFGIYLHRLDAAAAAAVVEPPVLAVGGGERILLVEDEEMQRTSLTRGLEHLGYKIVPAADGRSALAEFGKDPKSFDLIITDQTMPGMSGLELASEAAKIRPDLPVLLCTGFSEKVDEDMVGRHGIRELVMKPFTVTEITRAIGKAVRKA